jgi:hypothetical protein
MMESKLTKGRSMKYLITSALVALFTLAGCGVTPPIQGRQDPYAPPQVTFVDSDLARVTAVGTPVLTRDESGILHVRVPIRSTGDRQIIIDWRATFFDRDGQVLWKTHWDDKTLAPHVPDQINFNSLSSRAADFQLDLRYAK